MSNFLILDTTSDVSLAIAYKNGEMKFVASALGKGKTSERVAPLTEEALSSAALDKRDLDYVFCVNGPGSFTGIRIGVSFISAISFALGLPKAGISVFQGLGEKSVVKAVPSRVGYYYFSHGDLSGEISEGELLALGEKVYIRGGDPAVSDESYASNLVKEALRIIESGAFQEVIEPMYLKKSQAERMKDKK